MKARLAIAGAAGALLAASVGSMSIALADDGPHSISANIGAVSNYVWRGQTQTDDQPAIQGGLDYAHESGFSLGTWVSNVDFASGADYELDLYAGYDFDLGDDISLGVSTIYYAYPDDDFDIDFWEIGIAGGYKWFTLGIQYTVWNGDDNDDFAFEQGDIYYYGGADFELPYGVGLGLRLGYYDFETAEDPTNWGVSLSKEAGDFGTFSLNYDQLDGDGYDDDPKFWVGWLKEF
jgi:uncharacterized protein (TIGR02001 family)